MKLFIIATAVTVVLALGVVVSLPKDHPVTWLAALQVPAVYTSPLTSVQ